MLWLQVFVVSRVLFSPPSQNVFSCILLLQVFSSAFVEYLGGLSLLSPLAQLKDFKPPPFFLFYTKLKEGPKLKRDLKGHWTLPLVLHTKQLSRGCLSQEEGGEVQ